MGVLFLLLSVSVWKNEVFFVKLTTYRGRCRLQPVRRAEEKKTKNTIFDF